jgi:hypothetical protein
MRTAPVSTLVLLLLVGCAGQRPPEGPISNLPQSRQASFVESFSPTEWTVKAAGIGMGKKKQREPNALNDARRCAVYFCLYLATDPLLSSSEERQRFAPHEEAFFALDNITKYIAWEADGYSLRVRTADKKGLRIEKTFRIYIGLLEQDLIAMGVLLPSKELAAEMGRPQIVVIPEVGKGEDPMAALEAKPELKHAARSIESYLTARRYDVIVPEQQNFLNDYGDMLRLVVGHPEDLSYKIAISIGSDVYLTYAVNLDRDYVGSTENRKVSVSVRAFETTTARLLGTETGYSKDRPATVEAVTEEAIHDAVDKVLARVNAYWEEDLQRGIQYRLIFTLKGDFDRARTESIQETLASLLQGLVNHSKEEIVTDRTVTYLAWADPQKYGSARDLYQDLRDEFARQIQFAAIERQQFNRKLLLLEIVNR